MLNFMFGWLKRIKRYFLIIQFGLTKRIALYRELASLISSGYSQGEAIEVLWRLNTAEGLELKSLEAHIFGDLRSSLRNGLSFCHAIQKWVPPSEYSMLSAMAAGDDLAVNLEAFCELLLANREQQSSIIQNLGYPVLLVILAYGMLVYFSSTIAVELNMIIPVNQWTGLAKFLYETGLALKFMIPFNIGVLVVVPILIRLSLIYWIGPWRNLVDHFPIFWEYRNLTGLMFLRALSCFVASGMTVMETLNQIIPNANPYLQWRLKAVRMFMLNGDEFGEALRRKSLNWPNGRVALSLCILTQGNDYSKQMKRIAEGMIKTRNARIQKILLTIRVVLFMIVFGMISGMIWSMYDLQSQITLTL